MSYKFKPSYLVTSFFFILIISLVSLGTWQLNRASEKHTLQKIINQKSFLEPLSLNMPFDEFSPYQIVQATGHYRIKDSILLDNIVNQGKQGYHLITPFEILASRAIILVNRGWLPQGNTKEEIPKFITPEDLITITGHLSHPLSKPELLGDISNPLSPTPQLWYYMDQAFFSQINGYPVLPLILNLEIGGETSTISSTPIPIEDTDVALIQDWPSYDANSSTHIRYSILWFIFALFGLIAYISISLQKTKID